MSLHQLFRRIRFGDPVVVVSGLPRSGTSMTSKMLAAGGLAVVTDGQRTADEDNPRGYFEDERVKNLARMTDKGWVREARGRAIKVISYLLKDLPVENNYRVLFMQRNLLEVVASQNKMLARRGQPQGASDEEMIRAFEAHLWKVRHLLEGQPQFHHLDLPYREVTERPLEHARRIRDFLGRPLDLERMAAVVEQELYRNRR